MAGSGGKGNSVIQVGGIHGGRISLEKVLLNVEEGVDGTGEEEEFGLIKYAHNLYDRRTRKMPSEDTLFYFQRRRRTVVRMTANDGACWVRAHTFVINEIVTSIGNSFDCGSTRLGEITFLRT